VFINTGLSVFSSFPESLNPTALGQVADPKTLSFLFSHLFRVIELYSYRMRSDLLKSSLSVFSSSKESLNPEPISCRFGGKQRSSGLSTTRFSIIGQMQNPL